MLTAAMHSRPGLVGELSLTKRTGRWRRSEALYSPNPHLGDHVGFKKPTLTTYLPGKLASVANITSTFQPTHSTISLLTNVFSQCQEGSANSRKASFMSPMKRPEAMSRFSLADLSTPCQSRPLLSPQHLALYHPGSAMCINGWKTIDFTYGVDRRWIHIIPLKAVCTHGNRMRTVIWVSEHHGCKDHAIYGNIVHAKACDAKLVSVSIRLYPRATHCNLRGCRM